LERSFKFSKYIMCVMDMFRFTGFAEKWGFNMGFINFAYEIEFCT